MDFLRGDKNMKERFESHMKFVLNKNTDISIARNDGIKIGRKEGRDEGIKVGIEKGEKNKSIEIARNMLKRGYNITEISELSGLSIEEIKKL